MTGDPIPLPRDDSMPGTLVEFTEEYSDEESCAELLRHWKYGETGFYCPRCGHRIAWFLRSRRLDECRGCRKQVSLTAGTVMHGSRKPLRLWFLAMYLSEYEFRFNRRTPRSRGLLFQRLLSAATRRASPFYWEILGRPDGETPLRAAG